MQISVRILGFGDIESMGLGPTGEATIEISAKTNINMLIADLPLPNRNPAILVNGNPVPPKERDSKFLLDKDEITIFPALKGGI